MRLIAISRRGIHFEDDGDEVIWLWRKWDGLRWYSTGFESLFPTLTAIRRRWDDYLAAI